MTICRQVSDNTTMVSPIVFFHFDPEAPSFHLYSISNVIWTEVSSHFCRYVPKTSSIYRKRLIRFPKILAVIFQTDCYPMLSIIPEGTKSKRSLSSFGTKCSGIQLVMCRWAVTSPWWTKWKLFSNFETMLLLYCHCCKWLFILTALFDSAVDLISACWRHCKSK